MLFDDLRLDTPSLASTAAFSSRRSSPSSTRNAARRYAAQAIELIRAGGLDTWV